MRRRPRVRALDCEMVGTGPRGKKSVLARISVVGRYGQVLLDCLVRPAVDVTDWRTSITGIDASCFARTSEASDGDQLSRSQRDSLPAVTLSCEAAVDKANELLSNAVVVGHDLRHDFKLLGRFHHKRLLLRDTAFCPLLREGLAVRHVGGPPSLRALARAWLDADVHAPGRAHSSVEDARTAMLLYRVVAPEWEAAVRRKCGRAPGEATEVCPPFWKTCKEAYRLGKGLRQLRRLVLLGRRHRRRTQTADGR